MFKDTTIIYTPTGKDLIVDGAFQDAVITDNGGNWQVFKGITGWTTSLGDGIEVDANGVTGIYASVGNHSVELDSNNNSNMIQKIATHTNEVLQLSFDYSSRPGIAADSCGIEVLWNGKEVVTLTSATSGWTNETLDVKATGATGTLEFRAIGVSDSYGGQLDNIQMYNTTTAMLDTQTQTKAKDIMAGVSTYDNTYVFNPTFHEALNGTVTTRVSNMNITKDSFSIVGIDPNSVHTLADVTLKATSLQQVINGSLVHNANDVELVHTTGAGLSNQEFLVYDSNNTIDIVNLTGLHGTISQMHFD